MHGVLRNEVARRQDWEVRWKLTKDKRTENKEGAEQDLKVNSEQMLKNK